MNRLGLILATVALTQASPQVALAVTPAAVVRQYLADRSSRHYNQAYALLSQRSRQEIPSEVFTSEWPTAGSVELSPHEQAVVAFFGDVRGAFGEQFKVIRAANAGSSDMRVLVTFAKAAPEVIEVATATGAHGQPRIDFDLTTRNYPNARRVLSREEAIVCASHLKQISLGLLQYAEDHHQRYPNASHWIDAIMPYVQDVRVFHDPSAPASQKWSYAFNRNLSGTALSVLDQPASTVALFDSNQGIKNASDTGQSLPNPGRHSGGNNVAFADGHVKWIRDGGKPSFQLSGK